MKYLGLLLVFFVNIAFAYRGGQEGGGGGFVHDNFIKYGKEVLFYLKATPAGQELVTTRNLNLCRLKNTLNEKLVFVYNDEQMLDHRGSIVDAYTYPWTIYILERTWKDYFRTKDQIHYLVFKEMLRAEGTYFSNAIDISGEVNPLHLPDVSLDKWNEFLAWFESEDLDCLTDSDQKSIQETLNGHILSSSYYAPSCSLEDATNSNGRQLADLLLNNVGATQCSVEKSPCSIDKIQKKVGNKIYLKKAIFWKGQEIYSLPIVSRDLSTNKNERQYPLEVVVNDLIDMKYNDLVRAGICSGSSVNKGDIPEFVEIKDSMLNFEVLRRDGFEECPTCKENHVGLIGAGSKVRIISEEVKSLGTQSVKFIKARVVETVKDSKTSVDVGDEGWITLASTDYLHYYDYLFDILTDR